MLRMTFGLVVALYAAFAVWGRPVEGVAGISEAPARMAAIQAAAPEAVVLRNASAPAATRDATAPVVLPDPAAVATASVAPVEARAVRPIGEPVAVSLVEPRRPAPAVSAAPEGLVVEVTGSRVNLRAGPGVGNAVVGALAQGARAEAVGAPEGGWQRIRALDTGLEGFMFASYLRPV